MQKDYHLGYEIELLTGIASDGSLISCETSNGKLTKHNHTTLEQLDEIKNYLLKPLHPQCVDLIVEYFGFFKANIKSNQKTEKIVTNGFSHGCVIL